jgi:predicted enzyme related to lactoylglutathione lyase
MLLLGRSQKYLLMRIREKNNGDTAEDGKRQIEFYTKVFHWKTQMLGPEVGDYTQRQNPTTAVVQEPGRHIKGGFFPKPDNKSAQWYHW